METKQRARRGARRRRDHGRSSRLALGAVVLAVAAALFATATALGGGGSPGSHGHGTDAAARHATTEPSEPSGGGRSTRGGVPIDDAAFPSGACVAFAPEKAGTHHTVFLDAGHGGVDPGGRGMTETGKTIYEANENLAVELEATAALRSRGFRVVDSRVATAVPLRLSQADETGGALSARGALADVAARDRCADVARATVLVGVYLDAGSSPSNAGCITAYDAVRPFAAKSERLAELVQSSVLRSMNAHGWKIPNDGVQTDSSLGGPALTRVAATYHHLLLLGPDVPGWFTTPSDMPGALVEPLFISDPFEGSIASSRMGQAAIASGIVQGIERYFQRRAS